MLNTLEETKLENCKPKLSCIQIKKLTVDQGEIFSDLERYKRVLRKIIYLSISGSNISYAIGFDSQFMRNSYIDDWNVVICILRCIKKTPEQGLLYENKGNT